MKKILEVNVDDKIISGVYNLVKSVIVNQKSGYKIDIACLEHFTDQKNIEMFKQYGTDVYYIGYEGNKIIKQYEYYKKLKSLIIKNHYDCVHIHGDVAYKLLPTSLAAKKAGTKKIILHSHASEMDGSHRRIKRLIHKLLRNSLRKTATDYVACSDLAAKWMFPFIPLEKVKIINNGVDLDRFRFDAMARKRMRESLLVGNSYLLGHVGRFCYIKNHIFFINLMKEIKIQNLDAKLLLVGSGPDEIMIKERAQEAGVIDSIIFYGVSDRVPDLLASMDMFLLPSKFEGFPVVGVEAQANGLPVIFSDTITHDAKLISDVSFLGISNDNICDWIRVIKEHMNVLNDCDRESAWHKVREKKFGLNDTINGFLDLYNDA